MKFSKPVAIEQSQRLEKLARQIRESYKDTDQLVSKAREKAYEALAEAVLCGNFLNEAKSLVPHGDWEKWLCHHCKGVVERTAQRYMRLAKTTHVTDLGVFSSLRQAYIGAGIISTEKNLVSGSSRPGGFATVQNAHQNFTEFTDNIGKLKRLAIKLTGEELGEAKKMVEEIDKLVSKQINARN